MSPADCIFCKIANGAIPSLRIFETPDCLAFLDIGPLAHGHTLVIPKLHFENILDAPPELIGRMTAKFPALARAILRATDATGLNVLQNNGGTSGQVVMHLHFHLIPRREGDGLGYRWNAGKYAARQAESMQADIVAALQASAH